MTRATRVLLATGLATLALAGSAAAYPASGFSIWTIAGTGAPCFSTDPCGDGGAATSATFNGPEGVAVDSAGNVYVADLGLQRVRKIDSAGTMSTVAGTGNSCATATDPCGDGGPATAATLHNPFDVAVDSDGALYIADSANNRIRKVTPNGTISTIAGDGNQCGAPVSSCGDTGPATSANLSSPSGVDVDTAGNVYIADTFDGRVRRVSPGGVMSTVAGTGAFCATSTNACGDGGAATAASLNTPIGVTADGTGGFYIADAGIHRVRRVSAGAISTIAGNGTKCAVPTDACGDGGAPTAANLATPTAMARDTRGNLYIADQSDHRIRRIGPDGIITTIAGTGVECPQSSFLCGDGGAAAAATMSNPFGVAVDRNGDLLVSMESNLRIRWLTGPQAGPAGPQGGPGTSGPQGGPGAVGGSGPGGISGLTDPFGLHAFGAKVARTRVTVRYVVTYASPVQLKVKAPGRAAVTVARADAEAGFGKLAWNRRLKGTKAPRGTYRLTVVGTRDGVTKESAVSVRLR
jgi:hypothetical protein